MTTKKGAARFPAAPAAGAPARRNDLLRPQRLLHEAARDAGRLASPSGLGLDSQAVRERLVARLRAGGLRSEPVAQALAAVPRHLFVDSALANQAYEDTALPIGHGQTISKPSVVGRMLELLLQGANAQAAGGRLRRVLEIGSGCGYQAALLARLARTVVSIERVRPLHEKARANLRALPRELHGDVRLVWSDGREGHAPGAPYDGIVAAAGGEALPPAWLDQLADGGRLVAPLHDARAGSQVLVVIDKHGTRIERSVHEAVHFVPLKSGTQ